MYIRELVALGALDNSIEDKNISICLRLEYQNVLVERLLDVQNFADLQSHGLTRPLR